MKTRLGFKTIIPSISAVVILLGTIGLTIMNISAIYAQEEGVKEVQAGTGVGNAALILFSPQLVEIKAGQSITWYNPTSVPEPHTVTFVLNNNNDNKSYAADLIAPFTTSSSTTNSTQIMPLIPNSNSEPLMTPDNNAIIAINKRAYNPVVVTEDSLTTTGGGKNVTYMKQNANYSLSGTEDYVNSGWLMPKGQENLYPGSGNTFTMTFQKAGTYDYLCIIHPYMTGRVVVN